MPWRPELQYLYASTGTAGISKSAQSHRSDSVHLSMFSATSRHKYGFNPQALTHLDLHLKLILLHVAKRILHFHAIRSAVALKDEVQIMISFRPLLPTVRPRISSLHHKLVASKSF